MAAESPTVDRSAIQRALLALEKAQGRIADLERQVKRRTESIAVIGSACRLPGNVTGVTQLIDMLRAKVDVWESFHRVD